MSAEFVTAVNYRSDRSTTLRFIWSHLKRHPLLFFTLFIGAASNAILAAAIPYFTGQAFNRLSADPTSATMPFVGVMALAIILSQGSRGILQFMRNYSSEMFGQRIERDVRDELYASLLGKSMTFHDMMPVGEIMARVTNDVREMNLMMNPGINLLLGSGMFIIVPLIASPLIHPHLLLTPLIFVLIHLVIQYRFVLSVYPVTEKVRVSFGDMNAHLAETLDGLQVVKANAREQAESARFDQLTRSVAEHFIHQGRLEARYLSWLALGLATVAGYYHSVLLYEAGQIAVGDIVNYTVTLALFGFPVFTSVNSLSRVVSGYASAKRILYIINTVNDLDQNQNGHQATIEGRIAFENVSFGYLAGEDKQVIHNISFDIRKGKTVAIVGQTGAGKTTLTKLINRTYDPNSGRVLIDGVDTRNWDLESLRSQISIIEQDIFLFSRTIAENIAFGTENATQEAIEEAAKRAQAHEFIMSFPEGYQTIIGQRGVTLSGGQRQRIAIARAFLTNPPILILDDSTSAIDSATEDKIQKAIWAATKGRTTLLITHRLSQIRWADHIIVLKQGEVVAQGNHDHLMATSEAYRRIFAHYESAQPTPTVNTQA